MYSSRATAAEDLFFREPQIELFRRSATADSKGAQNIAATIKANYGIEFISSVVRDDELGSALLRELELRGVDLKNGNKHVVLVGEWDTFYGRALPYSMDSVISHSGANGNSSWRGAVALRRILGGQIGDNEKIHRFSYMRGLDGLVPGKQQSANIEYKDRKPPTTNQSVDQTIEEFEQPIGNSGLDYMRRLAVELSIVKRKLKQKGSEIGAIGVVGSDVYDKLLVLQALKKRFPNAVFFTTDLDARFLHPSQYGGAVTWSSHPVMV